MVLRLRHKFENGVFDDRQLRQHGVSVLAALKIDVLLEHGLHLREPSQFRRLIDASRSLGLAIDLLQRHNIRRNGSHDFGDAIQIELSVNTLAVMNVVAEDTDAKRLRRSCSGC